MFLDVSVMITNILGRYCSFQLLSCNGYIQICSCVNKCMILFNRFTIPDVSIAVYMKSEAEEMGNTLLSDCIFTGCHTVMFLK